MSLEARYKSLKDRHIAASKRWYVLCNKRGVEIEKRVQLSKQLHACWLAVGAFEKKHPVFCKGKTYLGVSKEGNPL